MRTLSVLAAVALAGMAYCHIEDVGMKFDEHVYYMAVLFCCNIAASMLLIPAVLAAGAGRAGRWASVAWAAAGALAILTIAGFLWSRTVGFPQMADHVGQWDPLGLTSLAFEAVVAVASARALAATRREVAT
jgi:hypothetical protein